MIRRLGAYTFLLLALASPALGDSRFVTDELIITVRAGKGNEFEAVKTLRSGAQVEVLEEDGQYMRVRTPDGAEGWVSRKYITAEPPTSVLRNRSAKELQELTERYNALVEQSKHITEISEEAGRLKGENARLKSREEKLRAEAERLGRREKINWFLAGGGVFFAGWIIGRISRKKGRYR